MGAFRGLTWDHPRGRQALEEAANRLRLGGSELDLTWDVHSLDGFESTPIETLAEKFDLIVLDHPHLGDAVQHQSLRPLDDIFTEEERERWARDTVGPSFRSYIYDDHLWALPLDTAAQVAAVVPDLDEPHPSTWDEVEAFDHRRSIVLSLSGPHAFLSFASLCVALGEEPCNTTDQLVVSRDVGREAATRLRHLAARTPSGSDDLSPIMLLDQMARAGLADYCPLVFGYVNYADINQPRRLNFVDAPSAQVGGRPGSTIGGTGVALTRRCDPSDELLDHLRWLMQPGTQRDFIPAFAGQPSLRSAWTDSTTNRESGDFYTGTMNTIDASWIRPRYPGFITFQTAASSLLRSMLRGDMPITNYLNHLDSLYVESRKASQKGDPHDQR